MTALHREMSSQQKKLLLCGGCLILIALGIQRLQMSQKMAVVVGLVEVLLAVVTGVAFGITVSKSEE